jgi:hypothetical protein
VIECEPAFKVVVVNVAFPLLRVPVPSVVVPSLKVTVPDAVDGVTVAVNFTEAPNVDGFREEETTVVVFVFAKTNPVRAVQTTVRAITRKSFRATVSPRTFK